MRQENKFKVGDRVRLTVDSDMARYGLAPGDTGTVLEDSSAPFIRWDKKTEFNWAACDFELELAPTITIESGKHYRTRSGKPTGRVTVGDTGFEAVVDGRVRIFDMAGGAVHGDDDIVEAWVPKVGERVRFVLDYGHEVAGQSAIVIDVPPTSWAFRVRLERDGDESTELLESLEPLPVAQQPAATLKIDAGKFYKTRDGRKVGPLMTTDNNECWPFKWPEQTMYYKADGYSCPGAANRHRDQDDLIAEWQETTNVGAQVDTLAEEYGSASVSNDNAAKPKFKVGDRVVLRNYSGSEHCYGTVEDVSVDGKCVLARDWSIGAEIGYLPVADLELADTEPDTTLNIKFTSDFSDLDAAILVRKKKLKKLIKLARKAGIDIREAA